MIQKSFWDPKGILNDVSFEDLLDDFKEELKLEELSDWFNAFNDGDTPTS